jgi:hypothetical protein
MHNSKEHAAINAETINASVYGCDIFRYVRIFENIGEPG